MRPPRNQDLSPPDPAPIDPKAGPQFAELTREQLETLPTSSLVREIERLRALITKLAHDKRAMEESVGPLQDAFKDLPRERDYYKNRLEILEQTLSQVAGSIEKRIASALGSVLDERLPKPDQAQAKAISVPPPLPRGFVGKMPDVDTALDGGSWVARTLAAGRRLIGK